jgi:regulator of replication initiation timing
MELITFIHSLLSKINETTQLRVDLEELRRQFLDHAVPVRSDPSDSNEAEELKQHLAQKVQEDRFLTTNDL